jgi:hypothetical protein
MTFIVIGLSATGPVLTACDPTAKAQNDAFQTSQPSRAMILFAILFAGLAVLGALIGLREIGDLLAAQTIASYGWALCINATAIGFLLLHIQYWRTKRP